MSRLPTPGSDDGQWGTILNDYLSQSHTPTGSIKSNSVDTLQLADGAVTDVKIADAAVTTDKLATTASPTSGQVLGYNGTDLEWTTGGSGGGAVTSVNSQTGDVVLAKADVGLGNVDNTADTAKPLSDASVTALAAKADDSAAVHKSGNETITGTKNFTGTLQAGAQTVVVTNDARLTNTRTPTDGSVTEAKLSAGAGTNGQVLSSNGSGGLVWTTNTPGGSISDADATTKGIVQLAGDLAGTAASPSVAKVKGVTLPASAPTAGQVLTATSGTATSWATPSAGGVTSVAGRTGVIVLGESDITNLTTDLAALAPLASPTFTGTVITPALRVSGGSPASGKVLTSDATGIATWQTPASASDATTGAKGIVQLAGDLAGTAASPSVAKVKGVTLPASAPSAGQVLTATSGTATSWSTPTAASDATTGAKGIVQLAGDLGGTAASPTTPTAVHITGAETVAGVKTFSSLPVIPSTTPTLATQVASKGYVDSVAASGAPDATTSVKGIVQLAGDLGGTAASPTTPTAVHLTGAETVAGVKTFSSTIVGSVNGNAATVTTNANLTGPITSVGNATTITANAVTTAKIIDDAITEPKLAASNTPSTNQVLSWNGTALTWATPSGGGGNGARTVTGAKTANYTASAGEYVIVNPTSGGFTVTLPATAGSGAWVSLKNIGTNSNAVLVVPNSGDTIEDAGNYSGVSVSLNSGQTCMDFIYDGTSRWYRVG